MSDDERAVFDLVHDEVDRTIERLMSIKKVGNTSLSSVYAEFIRDFKIKVYK